jgi:hypothetical protein
MIREIVNVVVLMIIVSFLLLIFPYPLSLLWQNVTYGFNPNDNPTSVKLLFDFGTFIMENLNFIAVMFIAYQVLIYATRRGIRE